jgi:hypothetical protein
VAEENQNPSVGGEEPLKPVHSLPRYSEPTPETHRKVSREEEAELALKHTTYSPGARTLLIALFIATIAVVPTIQLAVEIHSPQTSSALTLSRAYPGWEKIRAARSLTDLWRLLPRAAELKAAEKSIESASVVSEWLLPRVQSVLTGALHAGNEQVYTGLDRWLFYRPDVDYITGPPFLDPARMRHRAHVERVQPEPLRAIIDFRDQLAVRGIELIVMPVPMKAGIDARMFSHRADESVPLQNPSFLEFKTRLESAGVRVFDPGPGLIQRKNAIGKAPLYLESDTHWKPETMQFVAENLAAFIQNSTTSQPQLLQVADKEISSLGDIARMLRLPLNQNIYQPQKVTIHEVFSQNTTWRPSKDAEILLLGDSFSNIFSLDALGWGASAGLAEQLSRALGGRPLDCILRNSDAAFATREMLSRDLAQGRDRLADKKLVIWEFAARELAFGDWKIIDLKKGRPSPAQFFVPGTGEQVVASGVVESVSAVPRPGTVPYKDHVLSLHLIDVEFENHSQAEDKPVECLVYLESMRDNIFTSAAHLRPGDHVKLRLRPWSDVSERFEKLNRSEIDDPVIQLEEPCWGEPAP